MFTVVTAFLGAMFFLALTLLAFVPYAVVLVSPFLWQRHRKLKKIAVAKGRRWSWKQALKPVGKRLVIGYVAIHLAFFAFQWCKWNLVDNTHYAAKQYFAVGQVLAGQRKLLTLALHPDNYVIRPLTQLQEAIYFIGVKYLPEGDGERGVWRNSWFIYPYSRKFLMPYGTTRKYINPRMVAFLDETWETIETMSRQPIADKQMYRESLLTFALLAQQYLIHDPFYLPDPETGIRIKRIILHPLYFPREKLLNNWLLELTDKWQAVPGVWAVVQERPKIQLSRLWALIRLHGNIIQGQLLKGYFACDDTIVQRYLELRRQFAGDETTQGVD